MQAQGADCIRVVSRWADTHGRLSYATAHDGGYKASQRSRSKQGRKAPPSGADAGAERAKRRPGAKQRKHSRHLEMCRAVVERLDIPSNAGRLAYTAGICGHAEPTDVPEGQQRHDGAGVEGAGGAGGRGCTGAG